MIGMVYLTFDNYCQWFEVGKGGQSDVKSISVKEDVDSSDEVLWSIHKQFLLTYKRFTLADDDWMNRFSVEANSQLNHYFSFLKTVDHGRRLVKEILTCFPSRHRHGKASSSTAHLTFINSLKDRLNEKINGESDVSKVNGDDDLFSAKNEFRGEHDLSPIDTALYYNNKLIAFIEVDGKHHYNNNNDLRREDLFKVYLYNYYYPTIPVLRHRLRIDKMDDLVLYIIKLIK